MNRLLIGCAAFALAATAAVAQTATTTVDIPIPTGTDITAITGQITSIAFAVLSALLVWIGNQVRVWLATKTEFANTQAALALQKQYNEAIAWSMAYAESKVKTMLPDTVTINNDYLREAADYMMRHWPDLTKGISAEKIKDSIIARLPTGPATEDAKVIAATPAVVNG